MTAHRRSVSLLAASTIVLALGFAACGDEGAAANPDDERIARTVVTVNEDGTETVRQYLITKEEHARDIELKRLFAEGKHTAAVVRDSSCAGAAMWMFDAINLTGNEICFIMSPKSTNWQSVTLRNYARGSSGGNWSASVHSFWGGEDMSLFSDSLHCNAQYNPWTRNDTANGCVSFSQILSLRAPG
jgi:hypothetical protein